MSDSYTEMMISLNGKVIGKCTGIVIVLYLVGALIIYTLTSKTKIPSLHCLLIFHRLASLTLLIVNDFFFEVFGGPIASMLGTTNDDTFRAEADPIQLGVTAVLLFLLSKIEKMSKMKLLTQIPIVMIFYMALLTAIQFPSYIREFKPTFKAWEGRPLVLLKNGGTFVYLYTGIMSFHQVYTTIRFPTVRRVTKMGLIAVLFIFILGGVFGFSAYFSIGQENVKVNLWPDRPKLKGSSDIANIILKAGKLKNNPYLPKMVQFIHFLGLNLFSNFWLLFPFEN